MSENTLNCKGLACPGPVLQVKSLLDEKNPESVMVVVDNDAARQNVVRFLATRGYATEETQSDGEWLVTGNLETTGSDDEACQVMQDGQLSALGSKLCVFITADGIGRDDDVLGGKLMKNFLATLPELGEELWRLILVNAGVRLAVQGSPVLEELRKIEKLGATILVCGTCLDHFGLLDKKEVGQTTNMLDVVTSMQIATKVIQV